MCLGKHAAYNRVIGTCGGTFKVDLLFWKPTQESNNSILVFLVTMMNMGKRDVPRERE